MHLQFASIFEQLATKLARFHPFIRIYITRVPALFCVSTLFDEVIVDELHLASTVYA